MIAAVVPAAGRSARMGRPKLLMEFDGETLIHRVVTALREGGAERIIVVRPVDLPEAAAIAAAAAAAGAEVLHPESQPAEMRDSVELGLAVLDDDDATPTVVLLTPGDVPGITAELVARLVAVANENPGRIVIPTHDGRHGHPIVLPWEVAIHVRELPDDVGVNRLVEDNGERVVEIPVGDSHQIDDVDTPEDVARWAAPHRDGRTIRVRVRLFAIARERAGQSEVELEVVDPANVGDLREALRDRVPGLDSLARGAMISVDEEYASDETSVTAASRVALIPPVSGGWTWSPDRDLR